MRIFKMMCFLSLGAGLIVATPARAAIEQLVVLGDSFSDTGNLYTATGRSFPVSPPYDRGRFSNGPVWVEHLADRLHVPEPTPSLRGGRDYAFGGATMDDGVVPAPGLGGPPVLRNIGQQVDDYLTASTPDAGDLFVVFGGANDFLLGGQTDPALPANHITHDINRLAAAGASNFLVMNLPDLGRIPDARGQQVQSRLSALSDAFNSQLSRNLAQIRQKRDVTIHEVDLHRLFNHILADPSAQGFTVTDQGYVDFTTGAILHPHANPDKYLFFDGQHPTTRAHDLVAQAAFNALNLTSVPTPTAAAMALLLLASWSMRRPGRVAGDKGEDPITR